MITARLLNQDATLNNYKQIGGITFVNEDRIRVVIQLFNEELGIRHIPSSTATITLGVNFSDGTFSNTTLNTNPLPMFNTGFTEDPSIRFVDILTADAGSAISVSGKTLVGGNITFRVTGDTNRPNGSATTAYKGIVFNALQRIITS